MGVNIYSYLPLIWFVKFYVLIILSSSNSYIKEILDIW